MQTEHLGDIVDRDFLLDRIDIALEISIEWAFVSFTFSHLMLLLEHLRAVEVFKEHADECAIVDIGHTATVVRLSDHIAQRVPWNLLIVVKEHDQLSLADGKVTTTELVRNVPAKRAELSTLKDQRIEEAESIHECLVGLGLLTDVLKCTGIHRTIRPQQVVPQATGRLDGRLDTALQDGDGELLRRHGREPEAELGLWLEINKLLDQAVKRRHE